MFCSHKAAAIASFQAFMNCYLREVDSGRWCSLETFQRRAALSWSIGVKHVVEVELPALQTSLTIGVSYRSLVGRHTLEEVYQRSEGSCHYRHLDPFSAELHLIDSIYARAPERPERLELIGRVVESHQVMTRYLQDAAESAHAPLLKQTFIQSEQSTPWGHWFHPTPKSRQGIATWQHEHYCPELRGRFQLRFFAVARHLVEQESIVSEPAEALSRKIATQGLDRWRVERLLASLGDLCLIPVHPLQAEWLVHQPHVRRLLAQGALADLGTLGPLFTATSSVRTVFSESCDYMLKLSIPVRITNSLRINLKSELGDSVWVSQLLRRCRIEEDFSGVAFMEDPASITVALPQMEETGFEVIFRKNAFSAVGQCNLAGAAHAVAALTQDPPPGKSHSLLLLVVRASAEHLGLSISEAAKVWFECYFHCAIEPTIRIFDAFGIALEAHQQNCLIGFDETHLPVRFYYRDIQGLALAESFRAKLTRLVPELQRQEKVFEPDEVVQNGLCYYLFSNHLHALIYRFGIDGLCNEEALLQLVRDWLSELRPQLNGPGGVLIDSLLTNSVIPCKANLLTRIDDVDELQAESELAVYSMIENPLALLGPRMGKQTDERLPEFRSPPRFEAT